MEGLWIDHPKFCRSPDFRKAVNSVGQQQVFASGSAKLAGNAQFIGDFTSMHKPRKNLVKSKMESREGSMRIFLRRNWSLFSAVSS